MATIEHIPQWTSAHNEFVLYVISSVVAFPAALFFLYASLKGVFTMLRSAHQAIVKSSLILFTLMATFSIMYYYFMLDISMEKLYPREADHLGPSNLFHIQATSSHTLCLVLGVATSQWVKSHTKLSTTSRFLFSTILLSIFFIGSLGWYVDLSLKILK